MSSKVTADKFGDDMFREMYSLYTTASLPDFKQWCCNAIQNNTVSSNLKKNEFERAIQAQTNKDRIVKKMTDIMLAGGGHKVYKVA